MTAKPSIDPAAFLAEHLERAEPDLLRAMLTTFVDALMSAEADAICNAPYGARTDDRTNSRNGYRAREWDTRAGTIEVAIPKLRSRSYFPDWLLERRRRAERALTTVVATCYLLGVSTRRMEKLVETFGISRLSKSQVSVMAKELDEQVESFRKPSARLPTFSALPPLQPVSVPKSLDLPQQSKGKRPPQIPHLAAGDNDKLLYGLPCYVPPLVEHVPRPVALPFSHCPDRALSEAYRKRRCQIQHSSHLGDFSEQRLGLFVEGTKFIADALCVHASGQ